MILTRQVSSILTFSFDIYIFFKLCAFLLETLVYCFCVVEELPPHDSSLAH